MRRARQTEYLVCTQNHRNGKADPTFGAPGTPHRAAFLIGRIADVVPSPREPGRWLIKISEYMECNIPNIWGKAGPMRYPVWYTTLEALDIDLDALPPFQPLPSRDRGGGFSDIASPAPAPLRQWTATRPARPPVPTSLPAPNRQFQDDGGEAWARLDAILTQLDRVPDLPAPAEPFEWDAHGLPR